ncbi:hypothetical protein LRS06_15040 [Hymenobacter sp. J193]|uniref:hypothetical protein n=1 Tax=Hymenobacter sp. J193 TaxID=2898429 RepID=UPI0021517AEE|nr:hypothetical protein [Hymenobacter sp. J193]MCR5889060.1 hypothetical protein [Hymenobacter sp. J193]
MRRLILTVLMVLSFKALYAQTLTRNYVDGWVLATFPGAQINDKIFYILNGRPIPIDSLNTQLLKHKIQDVTAIDYIDRVTVKNAILCNPSACIIVVQTKGNQSRKLIGAYYEEAKGRYRKPELIISSHINPKNGEPVLIINGKQIFHKDAFDALRIIKLKTIIGLNIIDRPVAESIYGENAVNGLIIVTTK